MTDIANSELKTATAGNTIQITLEQRQERLPEPTKTTTAIGDVLFSNLLCAFTSAAITQVITYLQLPDLSPDRLLLLAVGLSVFTCGLNWALKKQANLILSTSLASVVAGVCLGGDLL